MDEAAVPERSTAPKGLGVVSDPFPVQPDPVPLLTTLGTQHPVYGWSMATDQLMPILVGAKNTVSGTVLTAGGRNLLYPHSSSEEADGGASDSRVDVTRLAFATGETRRANFGAKPGAHPSVQFAGSPDGERVAILEEWIKQPSGREPNVTDLWQTLWLTGFEGGAAQEAISLNGISIGEADDLRIQWSPDGAIIAFSLYVYFPSPRSADDHSHVYLVEAATGKQVADLIDVQLAGSASFSPDGRRLLVHGKQGVLVHDLNAGSMEHVAPIPRPGEPRPGVPRLLGFADDSRLLIAVQRGRTMTVGTTSLDASEQNPIIRWTGELDMYPVITSMPPGFWT